MALPKITYPTYSCTIPSTDEKVTFRPFTVEDEKLLLTAEESKDYTEILTATKNVIKNCVQVSNVDELTSYDVDYLFLQLRAKSVSPISELFYRVNRCELNNNEECDKTIKVSINLEQVDLKVFDEETSSYVKYTPKQKVGGGFKIELSDTIGVIMKHPGFTEKEKFGNMESATMDELIQLCIVSIYDATTVYTRSDFTEQELNDFYNSLTSSNRDKLLEFMNEIPQLHYETNLVCKTCGYTEPLLFKSLEDFFD